MSTVLDEPKPVPLSPRQSPCLPRVSVRATRVVVAGALAVLAIPALALDLPLARAVTSGELPGDLVRVVHLSEVFAHGSGVVLILLSAWVLDPASRRRLPRVAACAFGGGILANCGKLIVARLRPRAFADVGGIGDSFRSWWPFLPGRSPEGWDHGLQSFPSAHAATAFGLALALAALYPRGRWLFLGFAGLASFQRIAAGAHFLSDVLVGAALGCLVAAIFCPGTRLGKCFDRYES